MFCDSSSSAGQQTIERRDCPEYDQGNNRSRLTISEGRLSVSFDAKVNIWTTQFSIGYLLASQSNAANFERLYLLGCAKPLVFGSASQDRAQLYKSLQRRLSCPGRLGHGLKVACRSLNRNGLPSAINLPSPGVDRRPVPQHCD